MSRGFDTQAAGADIVAALDVLRVYLPKDGANVVDALATVETFCAVSLRLMAKTNPSKVRAAAVAVEIQSLIPPEGARP